MTAPPPFDSKEDRLRDAEWRLRKALRTGGRTAELSDLRLTDAELKTLSPLLAAFQPLKVLRLARNRLTRPPTLAQPQTLTLLDLDANPIAALGPDIARFSHLEVLSLCGVGLQRLPSEIGRLTALRQLWLDDNRLTDLPDALGALPALEELSVVQNRLRDLPDALAGAPRLTRLDIEGNLLARG